jgi:D-alanyl-D-alanine carboxypeptidase (penicillin-binding protein 5/6)
VDGARTFELKNTNRLLGHYDGMIGVKTGFTSKAGPCLVAAVERGDERIVVVLLNSPSRWSSAPVIFDRAFAASGERTRTRVAHVSTPGAAVH